MTVYVRRYHGPMSPAKTLPRLTPIRTGMRALAVGDAPHGEQDPLLVVAGDRRGAGGEDQLAAVVVRVGRKEAHAELVACGLRVGEQLLEVGRDRLGAAIANRPVGPVEVHERDRDLAVLRRAPAGEHVRANRGRETARDDLGIHRRRRAGVASPR